MKLNNDRSKTINRKTTKNYHHDPLLPKIADISVLEEAEGQLPWLNQNLNYQNHRVRHIFRVQLYTGSLWLSSSF